MVRVAGLYDLSDIKDKARNGFDKVYGAGLERILSSFASNAQQIVARYRNAENTVQENIARKKITTSLKTVFNNKLSLLERLPSKEAFVGMRELYAAQREMLALNIDIGTRFINHTVKQKAVAAPRQRLPFNGAKNTL